MERTNVLSRAEPAIVLVHGALTDASIWHEVIRGLHGHRHTVLAPALPMRSLADDAAYLAGVVEHVPGPVVLVGHSYGGAVISHPAVAASGRVKALVYVAAFQPDEGERAGELNARLPGSLLIAENLLFAPNALGGEDLTLRPERFAAVYAADVDPAHAAAMAASQRPIDPAALSQRLPGEPTWRSIPSWALVSTRDLSVPPSMLRFMAERAGSRIVEVESSHAVPVAQPDAVTELILEAVRTVSVPSTMTAL
jgi:pimeloyl-ACP methyl ester carboxylesterase